MYNISFILLLLLQHIKLNFKYPKFKQVKHPNFEGYFCRYKGDVVYFIYRKFSKERIFKKLVNCIFILRS